MTKQFTASEVRNEASNHWRLSDGPQQTLAGKMLRAFADRLESDEKTVPVAIVKDSDALYTGFLSWTGESAPPETKLYTHPSPSDAERLAEALRGVMECLDAETNGHGKAYDAFRNATEALAAHSAQAQPPAASVSDIETMVNRFLAWRLPKPWHPDNGISYTRPNYAHEPAEHDWPTGTNLFDAHQAREMVEYMLAAQENPNG